MAKSVNPRAVAAKVIHAVAIEGSNLDDALAQYLTSSEANQHAYIKALCFGVLRFYSRLLFFLNHLMDKPLRNKEKIIECLLLAGIYEILYMQTAKHAAVSESVEACLDLKKQWAKGLINAVLRSAQREQNQLEHMLQDNEAARLSHPKWLIRSIKQHWPEQAEQIMQANNQPGPLTLRVNQQKCARDDYLDKLQKKNIEATACENSPVGIQCKQAVDVTELPGFTEGMVSVQDQAAQLAAMLLAAKPGEHILDACAAPGGKTGHILESCPNISLTALDSSPSRLQRVSDNLQRIGQQARVIAGDATQPKQWWDKQVFDRILLDAPCSATGVIRRHPDIKLLRRADDIAELVKIQTQMLSALWPLVKSGGMLLYSTCSILAEENTRQIQEFVQNNENAIATNIAASWGRGDKYGRQILPGEADMDGFYYACLYKNNDS